MKVHEYTADDSVRHLASLYKALAHPVRLLLLRAVLHGEECGCHFTCLLHKPQPHISQQLSVLREAGLLTDRREGQVVY